MAKGRKNGSGWDEESSNKMEQLIIEELIAKECFLDVFQVFRIVFQLQWAWKILNSPLQLLFCLSAEVRGLLGYFAISQRSFKKLARLQLAEARSMHLPSREVALEVRIGLAVWRDLFLSISWFCPDGRCLFCVFCQFDFFLGQHRYSWIFFFNNRLHIIHRNTRLTGRLIRQRTVSLLLLFPKQAKSFENLIVLVLLFLSYLVLLFLKPERNSASRHEKPLLQHLLTDFVQGSMWKFLFNLLNLLPFHLPSSLKLIRVLIFVGDLDGPRFLELLLQLGDPSQAQMESFCDGLVTDLPSKSLEDLDGFILHRLINPFSLLHFLKLVLCPIANPQNPQKF